MPDGNGVAPGYEHLDIAPELDRGETRRGGLGNAAARGDRAVSIQQRHAAPYAARPSAGAVVTLPTAPPAHLFVARGFVELEVTGALGTGDSARITASAGRRVTDGAEMLVWEMHAILGN